MAVTTTQIRGLLNRPKGLNEATITEYISIRTTQVTKMARNDKFLSESSANAVTETQREAAIKFLTCVDCLHRMLPRMSDESKTYDSQIRYGHFKREPMKCLPLSQKRAELLLSLNRPRPA